MVKEKLKEFQAFLYGFDGNKGKDTIYEEFIKTFGNQVDEETICEWDKSLETIDEDLEYETCPDDIFLGSNKERLIQLETTIKICDMLKKSLEDIKEDI